ncbi:phosphoribosylanthranilate isomerase [Bacillus sp. EB600]|uniref:phosphoribosylanthranilate isomerase n=1 Tax=Bacillus sp. EB600 TaxID=2806345 RepID=UPI00210B8B29|nr:phosphoribosylanthranilate isomerase [Bacillus sp. EB600]MCQ6277756.1 phosphoribosylanthranilate isomerase [Bacillus sp. EB600]
MKVKICGITDVNTALAAVDSGADAIGFVFAESKRRIEEEKAREIIAELPDDIMKVGVFVNEEQAEIERIAAKVGLTHVQLHGNESPEFCRGLSLPVIKAYSVEGKDRLAELKQFPCEFLLLDGPKGKYHGGNGLVFDWSILKNQDSFGKKIILAGGLNEGNVIKALGEAQPYMVDVSSGVETDGKKDVQKIQRFIDKVKGNRTGRKLR